MALLPALRIGAGADRGRERRCAPTCGACGFIHYAQPKVGAGLLVSDGRRLLLLERGHAPWAEHWNLPAGYVEVGESPEAAALRGRARRPGSTPQLTPVFGVFPFTDDPRGDGVLLVYRAHLVGGSGIVTPEVRTAHWFGPTEIPAALCGGGHDAAINTWRTEHAERGSRSRLLPERHGHSVHPVHACWRCHRYG